MVKPVSLSDRAFAALRNEKRAGESDSDVVLRLIEEVGRVRKDPWKFARYRPKRSITPEEHLAFVARMRAADRRDPWAE